MVCDRAWSFRNMLPRKLMRPPSSNSRHSNNQRAPRLRPRCQQCAKMRNRPLPPKGISKLQSALTSGAATSFIFSKYPSATNKHKKSKVRRRPKSNAPIDSRCVKWLATKLLHKLKPPTNQGARHIDIITESMPPPGQSSLIQARKY